MHQPARSILSGIIHEKCPTCREGDVFVNKGIFPLKDCTKVNYQCPACNQKLRAETDNAPSMNYVLSVIVYAIGFILYALIWGITYKDNSMLYSLAFSTALVIICQPWLMRYSKVIYLYLFFKYKQ